MQSSCGDDWRTKQLLGQTPPPGRWARYLHPNENEYPAYIASRVWKARKHKDMAAKAQRLWSQLRKLKHSNVWIHHTPAHEPRAAQAAGLACRGMRGERINAAPID